MTRFYTPYGDPQGNLRRNRITFTSDKPSLTRQEFKDETDVNIIIRRFHKTATMDHLTQYQGQYGDFAAIDYHEAVNTVLEAEEMFQSLPSKVRTDFQNDPGKFLAFATDPENLEALRELGLAPPADEPPEPLEVRVVDAPSPAGDASGDA